MQIKKGSGKSEILKLKNANGKTIDIVSFTFEKETFCSYKDEVNRMLNKQKGDRVLENPRVFRKKDLEFYASLRGYSDKSVMCIDTKGNPLFFIKKEDILTESFEVDYLIEDD
jgi:hypothetical protein